MMKCLVRAAILFLLLSAMAPYGAMGGDGTAPRDASRETTVNEVLTSAPVIDGTFTTGEWDEANAINLGPGEVYYYIVADGEVAYVMIDAVVDVTEGLNGTGEQIEYIATFFDGDNDGTLTWSAADSQREDVQSGGKNMDWGIIAWGDGELWTSHVWRTGGQTTFADTTGVHDDMEVVANFTTSPNSGTPHRLLEFSIPYDGDNDLLGCDHGAPFETGINLVVRDDGTDVTTMPTSYTSWVNSWEPFTFPQLHPHVKWVYPADSSTFEAGVDITFQAAGTDENQSTLTYQLVVDAGAPIDLGTSNMTVKNDLAVGVHNLKMKVIDDTALWEETSVRTIEVIHAAVAPTIDSYDPETTSISLMEKERVQLTVFYGDVNLGQSVGEKVYANWTVNGADAKASDVQKVQIDPTHVKSIYSFETDYTGAGSYSVKCSIDDTYLNKDFTILEAAWTITVTENNTIPYIINPQPDPLSKVSITELQDLELKLDYGDLDGDPLTIRWLEADQQVDSGTKIYVFNSEPPHYEAAGNYTVKAIVSDGVHNVQTVWNITVTNINRPLTITSFEPDVSEVEVDEGDDAKFSVEAVDLDTTDVLSYSWYVNKVKQDGETGSEFIYTTTLLGEGSSAQSPYEISCIVTDGGAQETVEWDLLVLNTNRPPVPGIAKPTHGSAFSVGENILFEGSGNDLDTDDVLKFYWDWGDGTKSTKGVSTTGSHSYKEPGEYTVKLYTDDGSDEVFDEITIIIQEGEILISSFTVEPLTNVREGDTLFLNTTIKNTGSLELSVIVTFLRNGEEIGNPGPYILKPNEERNVTHAWAAQRGSGNFAMTLKGNNFKFTEPGGITVKVLEKEITPTSTGDQGPISTMMIAAIAVVLVLVVLGVVMAMRSKARREREEREAEEAARKVLEEKQKAKIYKPPPEPDKGPSSEFFDQTVATSKVSEEKQPCISCGTQTFNASGYCDKCAADIKDGAGTQSCPQCSNDVPLDLFNCPYCGFKFAKGSDGKPDALPLPPPPGVVLKKPAPVNKPRCPECGAFVKDTWKVCPDCDSPLKEDEPKKRRRRVAEKVVPAKPAPSKPTPAPEKGTTAESPMISRRCKKCGEEVEEGFKICPECGTSLEAEKGPATRPAITGPTKAPSMGEKKRITWSRKAKVSTTDAATGPGPAAKPAITPRKEVTAVTKEDAKAELEKLNKALMEADNSGKDIKKARNLYTLASSFIKSQKYDKAMQYINKSRKEL